MLAARIYQEREDEKNGGRPASPGGGETTRVSDDLALAQLGDWVERD